MISMAGSGGEFLVAELCGGNKNCKHFEDGIWQLHIPLAVSLEQTFSLLLFGCE